MTRIDTTWRSPKTGIIHALSLEVTDRVTSAGHIAAKNVTRCGLRPRLVDIRRDTDCGPITCAWCIDADFLAETISELDEVPAEAAAV